MSGTRRAPWNRLWPGHPIEELEDVRGILKRNVFDQDHVVDAVVQGALRLLSDTRSRRRPLASFLCLGPTGVGKTEMARALAYALYDSRYNLTKVDCAEFSAKHTVAKLIGAPPGYVGYGDEPYLLQKRIESYHTNSYLRHEQDDVLNIADEFVLREKSREEHERIPVGEYTSIILFDEIEKAHPDVWNALLSILDDAELELQGKWGVTDFSRSIIFMTSNVGSKALMDAISGESIGFGGSKEHDLPKFEELQQLVLKKAKEGFPPEFLGRFDHALVFKPLGHSAYEKILSKFISKLQDKFVRTDTPILIDINDSARAHIIEVGTDPQYGARPLERAFERLVEDALTEYVAAGQIQKGDVVHVGKSGEELAFWRESRGNKQLIVPNMSDPDDTDSDGADNGPNGRSDTSSS